MKRLLFLLFGLVISSFQLSATIWDDIEKGAETVGKTVEKGAETVGKAAGKGAETVGKTVEKGAQAVSGEAKEVYEKQKTEFEHFKQGERTSGS